METPGSWRLLLPRRHPIDFRHEKAGCGCLSILLAGASALAVPWIGALLDAFDDLDAGSFGSVLLFFPLGLAGAYSLILLVWVFAGGRSEIRMGPRRLRLLERIGPLTFMARTLPLERVSGFRAHPFNTGNGCLIFDVQGAAQRRWAIEYPMPLLSEAAGELARRRDVLLQGKVLGPADVEHGDDVLRLRVHAVGWRFPFIVGMGVLVVIALGAIWGALAVESHPLALLAALVVLGLLGLQVLRKVGRTHVLELSDASLKIVSRDLLRTRTRSWERRDVWGYESGMREDCAELRVRLRSGEKPLLLDGRDTEELDWIASLLRRGRLKLDIKVTSTSSAGRGTCQVCGDPMEERIVWCRKCRTPHHRECWIYTGMCATFGCREIGFTEA